jgi:hypothetical protein
LCYNVLSPTGTNVGWRPADFGSDNVAWSIGSCLRVASVQWPDLLLPSGAEQQRSIVVRLHVNSCVKHDSKSPHQTVPAACAARASLMPRTTVSPYDPVWVHALGSRDFKGSQFLV